MFQGEKLALAIILSMALVGCAQVHIKKASTDPDQEGLPYYLPRPYVQVYEPFVISSEAILVSGTLSSDGQYVLIDNLTDKSTLGGIFKSDLNGDQRSAIPIGKIQRQGTAVAPLGGPQGETSATTPNSSNTGGATTAPKKDGTSESAGDNSSGQDTAAGTTPGKVGQSNINVTNTTATYPPTLGRRFFDVVWMPDFDEKYVVQVSPGLGNSKMSATMTQGWGLYGLSAELDNSAVVKPLLDFYSTSLDALSKLAKSKILPASLLEGSGGPQGASSGGNGALASVPTGTRVSLKVTKVQVAAPGLYPILKPNENYIPNADGDPATSDKKLHLPTRPYTNIAFNTYEVIVIEATKPTGDTPMNLQRYFDSDITPSPANRSAVDIGADSTTFDPDAFQKAVNALLKNRAQKGSYWELSGTTVDGTKLKTTAKNVGGGQLSMTLEQLKSFLATQSQNKFSAANVEITEGK